MTTYYYKDLPSVQAYQLPDLEEPDDEYFFGEEHAGQFDGEVWWFWNELGNRSARGNPGDWFVVSPYSLWEILTEEEFRTKFRHYDKDDEEYYPWSATRDIYLPGWVESMTAQELPNGGGWIVSMTGDSHNIDISSTESAKGDTPQQAGWACADKHEGWVRFELRPAPVQESPE